MFWDCTTVGGYFYFALVQYIWANNTLVFSVTLSFYVGFCNTIVALASDIQVSMTDLRDGVIGTSMDSKLERIKQLINNLKFHSDVKRSIFFLFLQLEAKMIKTWHFSVFRFHERFNNACATLIMVSFAIITLLLCTSLVGLNKVRKTHQPFEIF